MFIINKAFIIIQYSVVHVSNITPYSLCCWYMSC